MYTRTNAHTHSCMHAGSRNAARAVPEQLGRVALGLPPAARRPAPAHRRPPVGPEESVGSSRHPQGREQVRHAHQLGEVLLRRCVHGSDRLAAGNIARGLVEEGAVSVGRVRGRQYPGAGGLDKVVGDHYLVGPIRPPLRAVVRQEAFNALQALEVRAVGHEEEDPRVQAQVPSVARRAAELLPADLGATNVHEVQAGGGVRGDPVAVHLEQLLH
mmetsp:Transcript_75501/g.233567  ORF Transcript_75501/g.233567 Transcript_75501/m.233567 type:complete len:215 (-) Transcript_75501:720-1364(-)